MRKAQSGFTIIEVLIVLAIAGLIILVVFLAVPAVQRNSRNNQRRLDAGRIITAINEYKGLEVDGLPNSCNNTTPSCFLRKVPLTIYDNQSLSSNNVSFWNRTVVGPFRDGIDEQLDPNGPEAMTRFQVRSYTKCTSNHQLTGVGANKNNLAAQFALEGVTENYLQCVEY